jgi:predicted N-acetyltransferase YhbS
VKFRKLERQEIRDIWSIDRAEVIDKIYYLEKGELVLRPEHYEMQGWPRGEPERYGPILLDCFDRGGTFHGAFDGETLIGAAVLETPPCSSSSPKTSIWSSTFRSESG